MTEIILWLCIRRDKWFCVSGGKSKRKSWLIKALPEIMKEYINAIAFSVFIDKFSVTEAKVLQMEH